MNALCIWGYERISKEGTLGFDIPDEKSCWISAGQTPGFRPGKVEGLISLYREVRHLNCEGRETSEVSCPIKGCNFVCTVNPFVWELTYEVK